MGVWEQMPDWFLDAVADEFGFEPPRDHGWIRWPGRNAVDAVR